MYVGYVAVIIGSIAFGFVDVLLKKTLQFENYLPITIIRSLFSVIGLSILFFINNNVGFTFLPTPNSIDWSKLPITILLCFISTNGLYFFMKGLQHTTVSNAVGFNKIQIVMAIIINAFVLHQAITTQKIMAMFIVLIGITLIEMVFITKNKSISKGFKYIIVARLCWSVGFLFVPYIKIFGVLLFSIILECTVFATNIVYYLLSNNKKSIAHWNIKPILWQIILIAIIGIIGDIGNNFAKQQIPIVLLAFLGLLTPIITLSFSYLYLKEKLTLSQLLGIALGLLGAVIYSL
jgi:drug/metabolite transporter (DMT)-like permease